MNRTAFLCMLHPKTNFEKFWQKSHKTSFSILCDSLMNITHLLQETLECEGKRIMSMEILCHFLYFWHKSNVNDHFFSVSMYSKCKMKHIREKYWLYVSLYFNIRWENYGLIKWVEKFFFNVWCLRLLLSWKVTLNVYHELGGCAWENIFRKGFLILKSIWKFGEVSQQKCVDKNLLNSLTSSWLCSLEKNKT